MAVPQPPSLLSLPRELRDQIYVDYLFIGAEHGYVYDFEAGKLRAASKPPVDEVGVVQPPGEVSVSMSAFANVWMLTDKVPAGSSLLT